MYSRSDRRHPLDAPRRRPFQLLLDHALTEDVLPSALALPSEFLSWLREVPPELLLLHALGGVLSLVSGVLAVISARRRPEGPERLLLVVTGFSSVVVGAVALIYWAFLQYGASYAAWQRALLAGPLLIHASIPLLAMTSPSRSMRLGAAVVSAALACAALADLLGLGAIIESTGPGHLALGPGAWIFHGVVLLFATLTSAVGTRTASGPGVLRAALWVAPALLALCSAAAFIDGPLVPPLFGVVAAAQGLAILVSTSSFPATPEPAIPASAAEVGGYELIERLGAGGMAEVWLGERQGPEKFRKRVAVKRMLPHVVNDEAFRSMFLDEARLAARLVHENIVSIFDLGERDGAYFIVMEHVDGVPLSRLLKDEKDFTPEVTIAVGAQLLSGLSYAHAARGDDGEPLGLVHRDISPKNLMVDEKGHVTIVDFGIARAAGRESHTQTGVIKGTLSYLAPEQLDGVLDGRADLFAAGVVLCEMLTGQRPVHGDEMKMLRALARADFKPPARLRDPNVVPPALADVVERALAPQPEQRWSSAMEMRGALLLALPQLNLDDAQRALGALVTMARAAPPTMGNATPDASTVKVRRDDDTTMHDRKSGPHA